MVFDVKPITSSRKNDCGATCLQMLLKFYGIDVDLDTLIRECKTTFNGCKLADINRAGRLHGLDMISFGNGDSENAVPWKGVTKQDRPAIVWWKHRHFVICCGEDENGDVWICNPDRGKYRVEKNTFDCYECNRYSFNGTPHDLPDMTPVTEPETPEGGENAEN